MPPATMTIGDMIRRAVELAIVIHRANDTIKTLDTLREQTADDDRQATRIRELIGGNKFLVEQSQRDLNALLTIK